MADKVQSLRPAEFTPDPDVLAIAEEMVQSIKDGNVIAVSFAAITQDRSIRTGWQFSKGFRLSSLVGAASFLIYRMHKTINEEE